MIILGTFPSLLSKSLSYIPINWMEVDSSDEYVGGLSHVVYLLKHVAFDTQLSATCAASLITGIASSPSQSQSQSQSQSKSQSNTGNNLKGLLDELMSNMLPSGTVCARFVC